MKLHFALIGYGKMGHRWEGVLRKYTKLDAIVDPAFKEFPVLEDVLANEKIDAVLVATPHKYLSEITSEALVAGKHVLCEKPGAIRANQIRDLNELAEEKDLVYKIGYNYRFHEGFINARKLYNARVIGDIIFIRARHGFGGREGYDKEWRINKEVGGGGHLHDQGIHLIDMVKSFMGKPDKVEGFRADTYWGTGTEDNAFLLLKKDNVIASIHSSLTQWKRMHTFEIYGTGGYLIVEGLGLRYGEPEKLIIGRKTKDPDIVKEEIVKCDPIADHSLELELKEFISAIENGTQLDPTPEDAYETLRIVEEIYRKDKI